MIIRDLKEEIQRKKELIGNIKHIKEEKEFDLNSISKELQST